MAKLKISGADLPIGSIGPNFPDRSNNEKWASKISYKSRSRLAGLESAGNMINFVV
jgi:hypothetical protein